MVQNKKKTTLKGSDIGTTISAIIIYSTGCDKKLFDAAKESVNWCDELVLINGTKGSFSDWRNEGLKKSNSDWILYIDTDEEVTSELKNEILSKIKNPSVNGYAIPRRNYIFQKEFRYSGQYPDYQKRLFKRSEIKSWSGKVHEEPIFNGEIDHLENPIIHHKNMTLSEMIEKTNRWSEIESDLMIKAGHPKMNFFRFGTAGLREFNLRFIKQMAFMDGKEGIIYGIYQIYSKLISYSKLWEKQLSTTRI